MGLHRLIIHVFGHYPYSLICAFLGRGYSLGYSTWMFIFRREDVQNSIFVYRNSGGETCTFLHKKYRKHALLEQRKKVEIIVVFHQAQELIVIKNIWEKKLL